MDLILFRHFCWARDGAFIVINAPVNEAAIQSIGVIPELLIDIFQMKQARAISIFIQHPRRQKIFAVLLFLRSFGGLRNCHM